MEVARVVLAGIIAYLAVRGLVAVVQDLARSFYKTFGGGIIEITITSKRESGGITTRSHIRGAGPKEMGDEVIKSLISTKEKMERELSDWK